MDYYMSINNEIFYISNDIDELYYHHLNIVKLCLNLNYDLTKFQKNVSVIVYENKIPITQYCFDINTFNLLDMNNRNVEINNIFFIKIRDELVEKYSKYNQDCFIPLNLSDFKKCNDNKKELEYTVEKINTDIYLKPEEIKESLLNQINHIKTIIDETKILIDNTHKVYDETLENYLELKNLFENLELKEKIKYEKINEEKNIFKVDKKNYFILLEEIKNNIRTQDDIPELFINKYKIFNELYEKYPNLSKEEQFKKFLELKKELNNYSSFSCFYDNLFVDKFDYNQFYNKDTKVKSIDTDSLSSLVSSDDNSNDDV